MSRPQPQKFIVIRKELVTPNMLRVTLGGENIKNLPEKQESSYVKLIFQNVNEKKLMRTYTIRHQRIDEIDIDFMLHKDGGPASTWARHAQPGDAIIIGSPGPKKLIGLSTDWQLLVGDMTALPTISVNLGELPDTAEGYAVIEVVSKEDIQILKHPKNIKIKWIINPHPGTDPNALLKEVQSLNWLEGEASVWAACEFNSMKALRDYFKKEKNVSKENVYISSYWKLGINEDQHKIEKRNDADE